MKDKIKRIIKRGLDSLMREIVHSAARNAQADATQAQAGAKPMIVEPDLKLKITGGFEAMMYTVPQAHMPPMIIALKREKYTEVTGIENENIDYVVGSENYWLTVDQDNMQYHVSPRTWPPLWSCYALPDPDVPQC